MLYYLKISIIIFYLIAFTSIKAQEIESKFFEGEVHFTIISKSLDNRIAQEFLELETGNKMIGKVKRNKYLMYQNTGGELGKTKMIFLLQEGIGYIEYENSDTIIQFSIEENLDKLISNKLNADDKKVILGDTCKSISFKYLPQINYGVIEYVEAKYYFNSQFKLDKNMYSKHKMNFWNIFVEMGGGAISVRNEIVNYPLYSTTYEATQIIEKEISENEFKIDKMKFIKIED